MNKILRFLCLVFLPVLAFGGATSSPPPWVYAGATNVTMPLTLYVKNVTIQTTGIAADIATIAVPAGITRWKLVSATAANGWMVAETAAGTLAAGTVTFRDGPNGTGNLMSAAGGATLPTAAGNAAAFAGAASNTPPSSGGTIYIFQNSNSVNAGTCSFYIVIFPLP